MATYWENSCSFGLRYVSWYKYLIVSLVFSHLGFWSGNLILIAPFPDLCLLVPLYRNSASFCMAPSQTLEFSKIFEEPPSEIVLRETNSTVLKGSQFYFSST